MNNRGYSLLELMIVVTIIGIIVSVAYPSYQNFVTSGRRAAAQADLMAFAAAMERHKAATFSYRGAASGGGDTGAPAVFNDYSPASEPEANKVYNLSIETVSATGTGYSIRARPIGGSSQDGDGDLWYFSDGRKAWDQNGDSNLAIAEYCWSC